MFVQNSFDRIVTEISAFVSTDTPALGSSWTILVNLNLRTSPWLSLPSWSVPSVNRDILQPRSCSGKRGMAGTSSVVSIALSRTWLLLLRLKRRVGLAFRLPGELGGPIELDLETGFDFVSRLRRRPSRFGV